MNLRCIELVKEKLIKIDRTIYNFERFVVIFLVMLIILLSFFQIILRFFLKTAIPDIEILIRNAVMIGCLFSSSLVTYNSSHFRIEIFERLFSSNKSKDIIYTISQFFIMLSSMFVFVETVRFISIEFEYADFFDIIRLKLIPKHIILILPVIFLNISFHSAINILKGRE